MQKGYLILENGQVFPGMRCGAETEAVGELVFTTGMTGYLETLTDPSYYGQIVMQTFPLIGNYGVIPADFESARSHVRAYVVHALCEEPSNFRAQGALSEWLAAQGVPCLTGVDTRQITRIVRERGVMNAVLCAEPVLSDAQKRMLRNYRVREAVESVTCRQSFSEGKGRRVVLCDYGAKANIRRELIRRGCEVITVPGRTPAAEILAFRPDGIMLSNGPGDPADNAPIIRQIRCLFDSGVPMFGICLGHQMMAIAYGGRTRKMKYGHRGANQPVQNTRTGRVYITSQNHGYCVVGESLGLGAELTYINANDGTCEGVRYEEFPGFSVQFHPEACGGPQDTAFLFDEFLALIEEVNCNAAQ